jgi:hypothetical protein
MINVKLASSLVFGPAFDYPMEETIKLPQLRRLIDADLIGDVEVVGRRGGWVVRIHTGARTPPLLAAATGAVRVFTTSDSAIAQLIRLGISRFQFIADDYESGTLRAPRPDRAAVLRQQTDYDAWLNTKLEAVQARIEAGTEKTYASDEVRLRAAERLAHYEGKGRKR